MDKDRVKGAANQTVGKVKEAAGKATGDRRMQSEGNLQQTQGDAQSAVGKTKDAARDVFKKR